MRTTISTIALFMATVLLGLGCQPADSPVSLDKYQINDSEKPLPGSQLTQTDLDGEMPGQASSTTEQPVSDNISPESQTSTNDNTKDMTQPEPPKQLAFPGVLPAERTANKQVRIKTAKGDIVFELLPDQGQKAASNFVYLAEQNFYDGLKFHRVVPDFVIQGGDPLSRDDDPRVGTGNPGYQFADDTVSLPYKQGIVAMANSGPNTNGSQFFIMLKDNNLPPKYSIFGRVISGIDVVAKIQINDVMDAVIVEPLKK